MEASAAPAHSVKSVCPYCGVGCGIVMQVQGQRVIKVVGDKSHPTNYGRLCTKGNTCDQAIADSGRLTHAYLRPERGREPARVDIDAAIHETAQRLRHMIDTHGPDSVAMYVSGQMSLEAQYLANKLVKGYIGSNHIESNSRLCMASAGSGYKLSLGSDGPPGSYEDFDRADVFFVIGANMADCHPILYLRMMDRVKAGAKLIVVDPRRTNTADKAHLFLQIKPGTDLALLNGLLHLLVKTGQTDPEFIAEFTEGWEAMPGFLEGYPPQAVAEITGIPEAELRQAAAWIGDAAAWMSCWTMGLNQSTHGTWNTNAICNLHLATGAICRPGSGPFSLTGQPNAMGGREMGYMGAGLPGQRSVLSADDRAFIEAMWEVPAGTLRTELGGGTVALFEEMKAGRIKACWVICTNPVASVANRAQVIEGLQRAELVITQDAFLDTETNRYADILLPGALWAEGEGVMVNSERNLTLMQQAVPPPGEAMPDWQIIAKVACAMGYERGFRFENAAQVFEEIKHAWNPKTGYDIRGASHDRLRAQPLQWPCAGDTSSDRNPIRYLNDGVSPSCQTDANVRAPRIVFATDSGKAIFLPRPHMLPAEMPDADYPFVLNTGRLQHQWHTMTKTGKIPTLNRLNPGPFIEIHPEDAEALGVQATDRVEVRSRRGRAVLPAVVTDRVRAGNCFAPFHWNDVFGDDFAINAVTSDAIDPISRQPEFKCCAVTLQRVARPSAAEGSGPPVEAEDTAGPALTTKVFDMKRVDALAALLGLDAAPEITLDEHERWYMQGYLTSLRTPEARQAGGVPVLPPTAPLALPKRLLVDGMLAGLYARSALAGGDTPEAAAPAPRTTIHILWASQTGNAEGVASHCAQQLKAAGHATRLQGLDTVKVTDLSAMSHALILTSTFGDGDPPDNATAFWQALQADSAEALSTLRYAVLAFGDSNYDQFCGFGRQLDARLDALGAQRLLPRTDCEPEYQAAAQGWLTQVMGALSSSPAAVAVPSLATTDVGDLQVADAASAPAVTTSYSRKKPWPARVLVNRRLNATGSDKEVRQFAFDLGDSGLHYEAGDALGVWPTNCAAAVGDLLAALKLSPNETVSVQDQGEMPLGAALSHHLDITRITPELLQFVAERSAAEDLRLITAAGSEAALKAWLWGRQLIDLARAFPFQTSAADFAARLKRLQPRLYSISSSAALHPREVHLTVSTVRYRFDGKPRGGVCSSFLADRSSDAAVPIFIQPSTHFRVPRDASLPIIMVGPGTGIAPFRAFLQEREATGATGRNWLFFGEQREQQDFYYRDELAAWRASGHLTRLDLAFSRDQADKVYVQHRMMEHGAELWRWLQEGAHFYVCGDASRMAKDVDSALCQIAQTHGGLSADRAREAVQQLGREKRYVRDVY